MLFAGIGSRETPPAVCAVMAAFAFGACRAGHRFRSGGAEGADEAFVTGCLKAGVQPRVFIPQEGYNNLYTAMSPYIHAGVSQKALILAREFHPAWNKCSPIAKKLHARNGYIVLDLDLATPVDKVVCWTPNESASGGTGQAIRIARHYGIPVLDLGVYGGDSTAMVRALAECLKTGGKQ